MMNLDYSSYPLNIYNETSSKSILEEIKPTNTHLSIIQNVLVFILKKAAEVGVIDLLDNMSIALKERQARRSLTNMIRGQVERINNGSSSILKEAQINLMATSCITDYLADKESDLFSNAAEYFIKAASDGLKDLSFESYKESFLNASSELENNYDKICHIYYIAFLLNLYHSNPQTKGTVLRLIVEALSVNPESLKYTNRPILFSNVNYKNVWDNLVNRIEILDEEIKRNRDLKDFVKWRSKKISDLKKKKQYKELNNPESNYEDFDGIKDTLTFNKLLLMFPDWEEFELVKYIEVYGRLKNNLEWGDNRIKAYILLFNRTGKKHPEWNEEEVKVYLDRFYRIKYEKGWADERIERYLELKDKRNH